MGKIMMSSGILASIVLCLVGLLKLPIVKYKKKSWYSAVLTIFTLLLIFAVCSVSQVFILEARLTEWSFLILLAMTISEVMVSYNGVYEGLKVKTLVHNLFNHLNELKNIAPEAKAVKKFEALAGKYNLTAETFAEVVSKVVIPEKKAEEKPVAEEVKEPVSEEAKTE